MDELAIPLGRGCECMFSPSRDIIAEALAALEDREMRRIARWSAAMRHIGQPQRRLGQIRMAREQVKNLPRC